MHTRAAESSDTPFAILDTVFATVPDRAFSVRLWDGREWRGATDVQPRFTLVLRSPRMLRELLTARDDLRLGEAYMADELDLEGDVEAAAATGDALLASPPHLADRLRVGAGLLWLGGGSRGVAAEGAVPRLRGRLHSRTRDRAAVRHHYDIGNDFYALFLDARMVYTCAYFGSWEESLEKAQCRKLDYVCRKLRLRPGERLLDIGCGWGALLVHAAANYGVRAHGITLSPPQAELARRRIREAGLEERCTVELRDYRELEGGEPFDKIASIGMFEHVGAERAREYFDHAAGLLRRGGLFLNHAIAGREADGQPGSRFAATYVFPDHDLVPLCTALEAAERAGFEVRDVESLREHYMWTLRHWLRRLDARRAEAESLVGRGIYRAWRLVFGAAAHQFRIGAMSIYQALLQKPTGAESGLPPTRDDWYAPAG